MSSGSGERCICTANAKISTTQQASHKASNKSTSLLDLPRELRDHIYTHLYKVPGAIFLYSKPDQFFRFVPDARIVPENGPDRFLPTRLKLPTALLRTCRQLHAETTAILYGANLLRFYDVHNVPFARTIYAGLVRRITFPNVLEHGMRDADPVELSFIWTTKFWPATMRRCRELLEMFPGLRSITIPFHAGARGHPWEWALFEGREGREERVRAAAGWLRGRCPWGDERLKGVLRMEIVASPDWRGGGDESEGRGDEVWDAGEFFEAFELMKGM